MERIGNAGWFITNDEYNRLLNAYDLLRGLFDGAKTSENKEYENPQEIGINMPYCPNCPYRNPADWTWRPWQAPWYGPGEPVPTDWKIGDGEWWKHQPYCTSTTEDNPNTVKDTRTNGQDNAFKCR